MADPNQLDTSKLEASVAAVETVDGSASTLLTQLAQAIRDAAAQGTAAVNALADRIDAANASLAAALQANTPGAPDGGGGLRSK